MNNKITYCGRNGIINIFVLIGVALALGVAGYFAISAQKANKEISSFEECAAAGYPIMESYPEQCMTPDGRSFTRNISPQSASFGSQITLRVNEQAKFNDNLVVTLMEINDSRCQPGVVCIWAGELSSRFFLLGGNVQTAQEIRLGTETSKTITENGYIFTLNSATEVSVTITVGRKTEPVTVGCTKEAKICPDGSAVGRTGPNCEFAKCPGPVACTMEAKLCPDGSAVGRSGPNCEFAPCPTNTGTEVSLREGEREGPLLVERIFADRITGQAYREYPVATDQGSPITLRIGESVSNGCTVTLTLIRIQGAVATFNKQTDYNRPCPICLSENTLIDTPVGLIKVQDIKMGMEVWTLNANDARVKTVVLGTSKVPSPVTHQMVHLVLSDGRELYSSPLHPTADGRLVANLMPGDAVDGATVVSVQLVPYSHKFTYDILPDGERGTYWANGILMGSTLK